MARPKTIFFSLSASAVFRNLFFFPRSVFDTLEKKILQGDKSLRLVLILPEEHRRKYLDFLGGRANDRCLVEYVRVSNEKTFLQKLFYFLYSYLVYTGTTKVLATLGLRPDEPPAGGKRALAPIKWGIARVLGRSRALKLKIVPRLYLKFFPERPFAELFEKYRPDLVFVPHIYGQFDTRLLAEAKERGVKTAGMAAGWDHLDKYYLPFQVDRLLVQSEHIREMAIKYQCYSPEALTVTGYPHFDFIVDPQYSMSRDQLLKKLELPTNAKIILYISASAYCAYEPEVIETMIKWLEEGVMGSNVYLVIRPYVGGRSADREFDRKKFERFESHPRVRFYKREAWGDVEQSMFFMNIMRHANAVISIFTTAVLEAAVFDVPLLTTMFDGWRKLPLRRSVRRFALSEHFQDVLKTKAVKLTYNFDELKNGLAEYLRNPGLDREKREALRQKLLWRLDGRASERIVEAIEKELL